MRDVVKRTKLTENCSKKTIKKYVISNHGFKMYSLPLR